MRVASFMVSSRECLTASPCPFAYRFPSFRAIPKIAMAGIAGRRADDRGRSAKEGIAMAKPAVWALLVLGLLRTGAASAEDLTLTSADIKEGGTIANEQVLNGF